eukprot:2633050-Prymnesium_polylepis.1
MQCTRNQKHGVVRKSVVVRLLLQVSTSAHIRRARIVVVILLPQVLAAVVVLLLAALAARAAHQRQTAAAFQIGAVRSAVLRAGKQHEEALESA